ncbi:hypothetical protein CN918_26675 [Priestia megaterium]|nr:hypothetical protein CN918_26675 [Priestia megaterium]
MKKVIGLLTAALMTVTFASAHVSNEYTIYDDTQQSDIKEDLTKLRTIGAIPFTEGASVYGPQDVLDKKELGYWAAQFLIKSDKELSEADYLQQAIDLKLIDEKDGPATYQDVIKAYFDKDTLTDDDVKKAINGKEKEEITKEEVAKLLGKLIDRKSNDGLFMKSGLQEGPSGVIKKVTSKKVTEGDTSYETYAFTIDGQKYPVAAHVKVLHGPTDLSLWKGKEISLSWIGTESAHEHESDQTTDSKDTTKEEESTVALEFIQAKDGAFKKSEYAPTKLKVDKVVEEKKDFPWVLVVGIVIAVGLVVIIIRSRKR